MGVLDLTTIPLRIGVKGSYGYDAEFFLFACIQEVSLIDKKITEGKKVRFTLQMGTEGREQLDVIFESDYTTPFIQPESINKRYQYATYKETKPCIWLKGIWPDDRKRMFVSNILSKMGYKLASVLIFSKDSYKECLAQIKKSVSCYDCKTEVSTRSVLKNLEDTGTSYLKVLKEYSEIHTSRTQLDEERALIYMSDMEDILKVAAVARTACNKTMFDGAIRKLKYLRSKMKMLADDPQSMMPDVIVWMESEAKRVAYAKVKAREVLYAVREYERGIHSGKLVTFFFNSLGRKEDDCVSAKMECYLWLGLARQKSYCFKDLPLGYRVEHGFEVPKETESIPRALHYYAKTMFQLHAHIYQARSLAWNDSSYLPNCLARVFIKNQALSTQVQDNTCNPIWDEMLLFPEIEFYGDIDSVMESPPSVVVEILNCGVSRRSGFLGRTIISVAINKNMKSIPALQWYDIERSPEPNGQLLAAFELFQKKEGDAGGPAGDADALSITPIPNSIRPRFAKHRIEILFWGLRELKRANWKYIDRPRIDVDCAGNILYSSVLLNYRQHSNFHNTVEYMDLELPEQEEYLPPITFKLIDTKSFGRKNVIATHVITSPSDYVFRPPKPNGTRRPSLRVSYSYVVVSVENVKMEENIPSNAFLVQTVEFPWTYQEKKENLDEQEAEIDWWSRYYISTGEIPECSADYQIVDRAVAFQLKGTSFDVRVSSADTMPPHYFVFLNMNVNECGAKRTQLSLSTNTLKLYGKFL
ncbi:otoferlin [Nephila pilipes]|uniref:Otoferlin n=1 Tax=Nephila pilipes TaxID=299642 RepID=A0A8X6PTI0_NEPPI|nr:otoferlin [Nephila pilipes]